TNWWSTTGAQTPAPATAVRAPTACGASPCGRRPSAARCTRPDRAVLRQRRRFRGGLGAVAGMGPTLASGLLLGVGEADDQRGPHRTKTRTYGGLAISSTPGG